MGPEAGARAEGAGRERGDSLDEAGGESGRGGGREGREEEREGVARGQEVGAGGGEAGDGGRGVRGDGGLGRGEQDGGGVVGGLGEGRGEGEEVAEEGRNRVALQRGVRYPGAVGEAGERRRAGGGGGGHGGAAAGDGSGHWGENWRSNLGLGVGFCSVAGRFGSPCLGGPRAQFSTWARPIPSGPCVCEV